MKQEISSLMDGELDTPASERTIRDCCGSAELRQDWQAYHVIGEALRGDRPRPFDVSVAVMKALQQEPTVLAPRPRRFRSLGRIALAAAASVATVGGVGWVGIQGMPGLAPSQVVAGRAAVPPAPPTVPGAVPVPQVRPEPQFAAIEVHEYLAAHRQMPTPDQYRTVAARKSAR